MGGRALKTEAHRGPHYANPWQRCRSSVSFGRVQVPGLLCLPTCGGDLLSGGLLGFLVHCWVDFILHGGAKRL